MLGEQRWPRTHAQNVRHVRAGSFAGMIEISHDFAATGVFDGVVSYSVTVREVQGKVLEEPICSRRTFIEDYERQPVHVDESMRHGILKNLRSRNHDSHIQQARIPVGLI